MSTSVRLLSVLLKSSSQMGQGHGVRVIGRQKGWIHTYFPTDAKAIDQKDRERLKLEFEGYLRGLGIVYGIHFKEGQTVTIVLECIPEKQKLEKIEEKLRELLSQIKPKSFAVKVYTDDEELYRRT